MSNYNNIAVADHDRVVASPRRIDPVHRIGLGIVVPARSIGVSGGIGLQEAAVRRRVDTGLVAVHAELGEPGLAGVLEPAGVRGAGDAIFVVAVDRDGGAGVVGHRHDRTALVGHEIALVRKIRSFVPHDRFVGVGTIDVTAKDRPGTRTAAFICNFLEFIAFGEATALKVQQREWLQAEIPQLKVLG